MLGIATLCVKRIAPERTARELGVRIPYQNRTDSAIDDLIQNSGAFDSVERGIYRVGDSWKQARTVPTLLQGGGIEGRKIDGDPYQG